MYEERIPKQMLNWIPPENVKEFTAKWNRENHVGAGHTSGKRTREKAVETGNRKMQDAITPDNNNNNRTGSIIRDAFDMVSF